MTFEIFKTYQDFFIGAIVNTIENCSARSLARLLLPALFQLQCPRELRLRFLINFVILFERKSFVFRDHS